ncbi:MAG: hypothetical protein COB66_04120 [Coxiella sp. (in: Bacteria)]|nr:MAG: hypothetical protein COB66_04120 [Coxiella sp. (in: g-proteobacteria)]
MVIVVMMLILGEGAIGSYETEKRSYDNHLIMIANPYPTRVKITRICIYNYHSPWKGNCERVTPNHMVFRLLSDQRLSDIQRIALDGENLILPKHKATCLVHFDHSSGAILRLKNSHNYVAMVNYVSGKDMVCELLKET